MDYSANMVGGKGSLANQIGSSMDSEKETFEVTNSKMEVETGFATYYVAEHCTAEAEKKRWGLKTYRIALAAIGDAG